MPKFYVYFGFRDVNLHDNNASIPILRLILILNLVF